MKKFFLLLLLLAALSAGIYELTMHKSQQRVKPGTISVATSFYPLYFFASEIGGSKADVKNITPSGFCELLIRFYYYNHFTTSWFKSPKG